MYALSSIVNVNDLAGTSLFGEHGWWSLNTMQPPSLKSALGSCLGKRSSSSSAPGPTPSSQLSSPQEWLPPPAKKSKASSEHAKSRNSKTQHHQKHSPPPAIIEVVPPAPSHPPATPTLVQDAESALPSMMQLTEQQEKVVESYLSQCPLAVAKDPKSARLLRKLKVRSKQRLYNRQLFDLDAIICRSLSSTIKYVVDPSKEYSEQVSPVLRPIATQSAFNKTQTQLAVSARLATPSSPETQVLDQLSLIPILSRALPPEFRTFRQTLCGAGDVQTPITSPYTARKLPPFIFRSSELLPAKVKLNHSIHSRVAPGDICCVPQPESIDFCYLQEHHLPAVNNFVSHFFWPVDLSECLQYPDFTCVVLYGKLVVGCGFMTPDVKVNEAYISFLLVHPDFQRCSIGKIILYHLIQSCMGKDITLHVSVDNPAMLLYQTMGFKAERYCLDFYRHYYPEGHYLSKNAYFMRLRK